MLVPSAEGTADVAILLVIGLLVSLRGVASATRGKDARGRPERTPAARSRENLNYYFPRRSLIRLKPGTPANMARSPPLTAPLAMSEKPVVRAMSIMYLRCVSPSDT